MLMRLNPTAEEAQALSAILTECKTMEGWVDKSAVPPKAPAAPSTNPVPASISAETQSKPRTDQVVPTNEENQVFEIEDGLARSEGNIKIKSSN